MINKSENASSAPVSIDVFANTQTVMGNVVDVSNTANTSISALPTEMLCHIGTFLDLKDKINFSQALADTGLCVSFDHGKILQQFSHQFLTQKINILLENKNQYYDFSKFYNLEEQSEENTTGIYSLLFKQMYDSFKEEKVLAEKIAQLVEVLDFETLDVDRIQFYVDKEDVDAKKDCEALIDYLFPNLTDTEVRKEIEHRVQVFDARWNTLGARGFSFSAKKTASNLLAFLKMEKEYRGMPVEFVKRKQKLASSHLLPIIQRASEKIQAMPTEALRALLIMALDELQRADFCEKMIEFGAKDNPFYLKGSPYFYALKSDLLFRMSMTEPKFGSLSLEPFNYQVYKRYVAYYAEDAYLRKHVNNMMSWFLKIQIKNGEDPKSENKYGDLSFNSPYHTHIQSFYTQMEEEHDLERLLEEELESRASLMKDSTPAPCGLNPNSPEFILSAVARDEISLSRITKFLNKNPHQVNAQDPNGDTLLHLCIKLSFNIVEILVKLNADLNIKNKEGFSPLMLAVQFEEMWALNLLLKQPTLDVNQSDNSGNTALHYAVMSNKKMAMHRLLRHQATDQTLANNDGKKPHDLAELAGLSSLFNCLSLV